MARGLTNIIALPVHRASTCLFEVSIFNDSAVNLYLGSDISGASKANGYPIPSNTSYQTRTKEDLYIGADADNISYKYRVTPQS